MEELVGGQVVRQYTYGHGIVSQRQLAGGAWAAELLHDRRLRQRAAVDRRVRRRHGHLHLRRLRQSDRADGHRRRTPYLYRSERFDADLGLYHLRARSYDPNRGRFTTVDPFPGFTDDPVSLHRYLYANADPVNFYDPTGLSSSSEYGILTRIMLRARVAIRALGRAIACVFFYVASWIASIWGYPAWNWVRRAAARRGLPFCVCKFVNTPPGWTDVTNNKEVGDAWRDLVADLFFGFGADVRSGAPPYRPERREPGIPGTGPRGGPGRRDIDVDVKWWKWNFGIETKTGDSPYDKTMQKVKDDWLRKNRRYRTFVWRFPQGKCLR